MPGAIGIIIVLLLFPIAVLIGGLVLSSLFGFALQRDGDFRGEGSELANLND